MALLYQCQSLAQAHMIRSFLLEHEIETYVVHEFGATLWPGTLSGCALAIHESDLEFLPEALAEARLPPLEEHAAAEIPPPADVGKPIYQIAGFLPGTMLIGSILALIFGALLLAFEVLDWSIYVRMSEVGGYSNFRSSYGIGDIALLVAGGIVAGLLASGAILLSREFRPEDHGEFSTEVRLAIFGVLVIVSPIGTFLLWLIYWFFG